jgi:hypothetical protein
MSGPCHLFGSEIMHGESERTGDVYEQLPNYQVPPLIAVPRALSDYESLDSLGVVRGLVAQRVVKTACTLGRFEDFRRKLPQHLESLLRRTNLRCNNFAPLLVAASVALADHPRPIRPLERAATILGGLRELREDIYSGDFAPDLYGNEALEMGQYPNLFGTNITFDGKKLRVFKTKETSHITVVVRDRIYSVDLGNWIERKDVADVLHALGIVTKMARESSFGFHNPSITLLSALSVGTQLRFLPKLSTFEANAASLKILRHSFVTICLDLDSAPSSAAEALWLAQSGNCTNRWYHSGLQVVVFGNSKACLITNFKVYLDGNIVMRAAGEIQRRAAKVPLERLLDQKPSRGRQTVTELRWVTPTRLKDEAFSELHGMFDNQPSTYELQGLGTEAFSPHGLNPIKAFVIALQIAAWRLTGRILNIGQFLSLSKFRCMGLTVASATTPEVKDFVEALFSPAADYCQLQRLFRAALSSQDSEYRKARSALPVSMFVSLLMKYGKQSRRRYSKFIWLGMMKTLRLLGLVEEGQCDILISHPRIESEVPLVGRPGIRVDLPCFGLHYQMFSDRTALTIMPGKTWQIANCRVAAELRTSLKAIQYLALGDRSALSEIGFVNVQ